MAKKNITSNAVRLNIETIKKLKDLKITYWGVDLDTYDQKIAHLIWSYKSYHNNNWKK